MVVMGRARYMPERMAYDANQYVVCRQRAAGAAMILCGVHTWEWAPDAVLRLVLYILVDSSHGAAEWSEGRVYRGFDVPCRVCCGKRLGAWQWASPLQWACPWFVPRPCLHIAPAI